MDMSLEEILMLDDTKRLYFENSNESESSGDEGSVKRISRICQNRNLWMR